MRLKRLEIQGFKSFARPVCLEFGDGITAIVGPNGSGKSNISDAVRWVLGEQSAKSLRGQRMEDVIFAGSDGKRPLGMAEVQLTLDNSQGFLPLDYSEVTVTRRVYRSGDSEFFINKQSCRLRDIHDLFTDTGLGREGYAIIGQGQIEAVLSVRSEDRRVLLEETAGIIKYRQRKEQALSKLEETAIDLLRVSDILHELEGQLGTLSEQAEQARLYLNLADQLQEAELDYSSINWGKLEKKLGQVQANQEQTQRDFAEWNRRCQELEEKKMELESLTLALETQIEQEQRDLFAAAEAYNDGLHTIELYEDRLKNHESRSEQLVILLAEKREELALLADQEQAVQVQFTALLNRIGQQEEVISQAQQELASFQEQHRLTQVQINDLKDGFFDFVRELADRRNFQRSFKEREKGLKSQLDANREEIVAIHERIDVLSQQLAELKEAEAKLQQELVNNKEEQRAFEGELEQGKTALGKTKGEIRRLEALSTQVAARLKTLQELESGYEGYGLGVRRLMQNPQLSSLVLGTVAEVIKVPAGLETAFEVALGSALQNVITANEGDAKRLIKWLQEVQGGRVTFLPLDSVRGSELAAKDRHLLSQPGVLGTGLDLLEYPERFRPVIASLLGRVIITEDLDCALSLKRSLSYFSRIVTRDGSVVFPSGAMTGGSLNNRTSGLLARKAELEELAAKLTDLGGKLEEEQSRENDVEQRLSRVELYLEELQGAMVQTQFQLQSNGQSQSQTLRDRQALEGALGQLQEKISELELLLDSLGTEGELAATEVVELEAEEGARREEINLREQHLAVLGESMEQAAKRQTKEQVHLAELKGNLEAIRQQINNLEQRKKSSAQVYREAEVEQERLGQEKTEFKQIIEQTRAANELRKITQANLEDSLTTKRAQRQKAQSEGATVNAELSQAQKEQLQRERALYKGEVELNQLEQEQEQILEALAERELSLETVLNREVTRSESALKRAIEDLRGQIKDLGLVNPGATQEYERVQERCEFLRTQLDDLNEARDSLQDVINEMDKLCRTRLWDTFTQVQTEFQTLFSQLFNGGKADLVLTDPDSILTTGIEVMARPPGKKLQNLLLLSGGERALTAIALLFAIRKVKPTPFCILDEIDAALDESNLERFTDLMEEFAKDTQFLVITHRPKTMEGSNTLYGVTMGEDAISQIISVALT